jgi:S-formylglutathione hydrolase FrmB
VLPWSTELAGRIEERVIDSRLLRGNPLGDPHERPLWVYLPPGYDDEPGKRYPAIYVIQGFTGYLAMWRNRAAFTLPYPETADAVFAGGKAPGAIVVYVDAWTSYGGSQYVDSLGMGAYHSYLCDEVVSWVDARYRTKADRDHRAITGKSSGGYGAMITPMLRPDVFGAFATHAGDALFEYCYLPSFITCVRGLRPYDGDIERWWREFRTRDKGLAGPDDELLANYAAAAAYSPAPDGTPQLPFDTRTGVIKPELWQRWLDWDPVRMVPGHADALRSMRAIWIDGGIRDEYALDLGAQAFHQELLDHDVDPGVMHFELFDAGHAAITYRYPLALAWLANRLADE